MSTFTCSLCGDPVPLFYGQHRGEGVCHPCFLNPHRLDRILSVTDTNIGMNAPRRRFTETDIRTYMTEHGSPRAKAIEDLEIIHKRTSDGRPFYAGTPVSQRRGRRKRPR